MNYEWGDQKCRHETRALSGPLFPASFLNSEILGLGGASKSVAARVARHFHRNGGQYGFGHEQAGGGLGRPLECVGGRCSRVFGGYFQLDHCLAGAGSGGGTGG